MIELLAAASLALGGSIALINWCSIYASHKSARYISPVPLLGSLFLVGGLLGFEQTRPYAWAGIVADYGTLCFFIAVPILVWDAWTTSNRKLVHRFLSNANGRRDDIKLFKRDKFTIRTDYIPPVPCNECGALAASQGWVGRWRTEGDTFRLEGYAENRILKITKKKRTWVTEEENYPESNPYQHDRMDGLTLNQLA